LFQVIVPVADIEAAATFYGNVLGDPGLAGTTSDVAESFSRASTLDHTATRRTPDQILTIGISRFPISSASTI
jgi:extradiol dioxygenase family protein